MIASENNKPFELTIALPQDIADRYTYSRTHTKIKTLKISPEDLKDAKRGIISLIVLEQALHKAEFPVKLKFVISPNVKRSHAMLRSGKAMLSMGVFEKDFTPKGTFKSSVLINQEEQIRGIFGLKSNKALMAVKTAEELTKFSAVTHSAWFSDRKTLESISPSKLELVGSFSNIFKLIAYRDVDFTLLGLNEGKASLHKLNEIELVPVPGLLVKLKDAYHFIISKKHPESKRLYSALEKGLEIMRKEGLLKRFFQSIGYSSATLENWQVIND